MDLDALATEITKRVEIRLEHEAQYDWVAFILQRESDTGALTKYFGKVAGEDEFKVRGIEARQRSTPPSITAPLSVGDWWHCVVTEVQNDHIATKPRNLIPRNSDIPRGAPPVGPTQSLNHLLSEQKP